MLLESAIAAAPMSSDAIYQETVARGLQNMQAATVCIAALARDCAPRLRRNLPWVDSLRAHFKKAHVVIFENDSRDTSKQVLTAWSSGKPDVTVVLHDFGTSTVPRVASAGVNPGCSRFRIEKMARYRNQYLGFAGTLGDFDYLIVVDLDLHHIDLEGIAHALGQEIPWDAQFANGRATDPRRPQLGDFYWDAYAFFELGDTRPQTWDRMTTYWDRLKPLAKGMPLFAVQSAFGGMGIYRWEAIKGLRYGVESNQDDHVEVLSEHVYLHRQMIAAGYSRLFVNPSMTVYYDDGPRPRILFVLERLFHSLAHNGIRSTVRKAAGKLAGSSLEAVGSVNRS